MASLASSFSIARSSRVTSQTTARCAAMNIANDNSTWANRHVNNKHLKRTTTTTTYYYNHAKRFNHKLNASEVTEQTNRPQKDDFYELTLPKPLDVKFARGNDGGCYVAFIPPNEPKYEKFEIGDKIEGVSASFGDEVWPAESFGQVMYAIKNRNGDIYLKMKKCYGDFSAMEVEKNSQFKSERAGGNYGQGTKEQQMNNYSRKRELENERLDMFDEAIALYNQKKFDDALIQFEEVAAHEPKNYMSDNFETTTDIYRVCQYNIACCFSNIGKIDESLLALRRCMASGWTDYRKIRTDPSLAKTRESQEFSKLMNMFDEPIFNENASKFLSKMFGKK